MSRSDIQVVVPAHNAEADLRACLHALRDAGFTEHGSILLVDDGSTDDTCRIARAADVTVLKMSQNTGAAAARDFGVHHTSAPIILFVDSDVVVAPNTRAQVQTTFADSDVAATFGAYDAAPAAPGLVSQYRNLLHRHVHLTGPDTPRTFWTGLGAVRRQAYDAVGGFDTDQRMMEDIEFGLRLSNAGFTIQLNRDLNGQHRKHWTLASMIRMDLLDRAVPWARLMQRHGMSRELNLSLQSRISAVMALALVLSLLLLPIYSVAWLPLTAALAGFIACNSGFLRGLARLKGPGFAIAATLPHLVHTWCAIIGFAWVVLIDPLRGRTRQSRRV